MIGQIIENNRIAKMKYKTLVLTSRPLIARFGGIAACLSIPMVGALQ